MNFLLLFLDGVWLGIDDPEINPLAAAEMPNLHNLLDGNGLFNIGLPIETERSTLVALDPVMDQTLDFH